MANITSEVMLKAIEAVTNRVGQLAEKDGTFVRDTDAVSSVNGVIDRLNTLTERTDEVTLMEVADALLDVAAACTRGIASMVAGAEVSAVEKDSALSTSAAIAGAELSSMSVESAATRIDEVMKNLKSIQ
jgi:hypothetical protein